MKPFAEALERLGLAGAVSVLPVQSGYPTPKLVNLVLTKRAGRARLFEASAARPDIVQEIQAKLDAHGVGALDALLVTHCHGDHGGSCGLIAGRGRPSGERAPIYLHSAGYRFLTHPQAAFINETYELFLARSHWGRIDYSQLSNEEMLSNALRRRFADYFSRTPRSALRFVDRGEIPQGIEAVVTPGHSLDCMLYYDTELQIAVPGDTIICTGLVDKPDTHAFVIPIFTVTGQTYSMAYERFLQTIRVLRRFFETRPVLAVLPPHGRFAVTEPLDWVAFAEAYFQGLYRALLEDYLGDPTRRRAPFHACDLSPFIASAGAHPVSTLSHIFGMLCTLADEGYLSLEEHPHTRQISFWVERMPPEDYVARRLSEDPGPFAVFSRL